MTDPKAKKGFEKVGKVIWPLLTIALAIGITWEVYSGVAYHKTSGPSVRASDPGLYWFEIVFQIALMLLCASVAVRVFRKDDAR